MVNFELACWLDTLLVLLRVQGEENYWISNKESIQETPISLSDAPLLNHREMDGEPGYSKCRYVVYVYFETVRTMNNLLTWSPLISPKESWKRTSSPSWKDKIPKIHPRHKPSNIILLVRMPYLREKNEYRGFFEQFSIECLNQSRRLLALLWSFRRGN